MIFVYYVTRDAGRKYVTSLEPTHATSSSYIVNLRLPTDYQLSSVQAKHLNDMKNVFFLAGLLMATLLTQSCEGSMSPEHPQTAFCKADFGRFIILSNLIPPVLDIFVSFYYSQRL